MKFQNSVKPFFIAEVGQNHQGSIEIALKYIEEFAALGANAIKFQLRNNRTLFSSDSYNKSYDNHNSFGLTYGEHRENLELDFNSFKKIVKFCKKNNVKFMATPFDEESLDKLIRLKVDIIKIASFDLGNLPFIDKIAKTKKPLVLSTGGGNLKVIDYSVNQIMKYHNNFSILHCVSEYPCEYSNLNLDQIKRLKKKYPKVTIGISDHFNGILSGPIAYMLGARVFEKHVTFNRGWKGSDHSFALEPLGFKKFVRDIKRTPEMIIKKDKKSIGKEPVFEKLGKSLIFKKNLKKGKEIKINDLSGRILEKNELLVRYSYLAIGSILKYDVKAGDPVKKSSFKKVFN